MNKKFSKGLIEHCNDWCSSFSNNGTNHDKAIPKSNIPINLTLKTLLGY